MQRFFQEQVWEQLKVDAARDPRLRVAEDDEGIAAVYLHLQWDSEHPNYQPPLGYGQRLVAFLGIAVRHRRQGGSLADEVLTDALYEALDADDAPGGVSVWGKVHWRNEPCKSMLTRRGFEYASIMENQGPLEHWYLDVARQ
ncbi:hypothetical protein [Streptomyces sp. BH105]|uniref:hypothetical protein n=1 Tax=Streptomyces sp. BH105 TaxID=3410408 RepID=UPI003CEA7301